MVLMKVDFPQPFGPRMARFSPAPMRSVKSSSATFCPRMTRRLQKSRRGGCRAMGSEVLFSVDEGVSRRGYRSMITDPRSLTYPLLPWITLKLNAAPDLPFAAVAGHNRRRAHLSGGGDVFLCPDADPRPEEGDHQRTAVRNQQDGQRFSDFEIRRQAHPVHDSSHRRQGIQAERPGGTARGEHCCLRTRFFPLRSDLR